MKEGDVRIKRIENGWVVSRWITYPLPTPSPICDGRRVRSDYCQTWDEIMKILETCDVINSVMEE